MRKYYLDNLRWVTVLLVILYHVVYMFNGIIPDLVVGPFHPVQYQDGIQYLLYPWFMVLLFVVAGASSRLALEHQSPREFLAARTRKLLVPSTIGLFAFHWLGGYVNMCTTGAFEHLPPQMPSFVLYPIMAVSGTGVLWFIQMLWLYSLLLLVIHRLEKGALFARCEACSLPVLLALVLPLWLSAQVLNAPVITVYRFGIYGLAFLLGYFILAHERVVERLSRRWLPLTIAAALLGAAYTWRYFGENYAAAPLLNSPFSILYGWVAVLAAFALAKRFGDRTSPLADWMNRHSFGLYVLHYLPLSAAALWLCRRPGLPALPSYLITGLAALGGSLLLYEVISRLPVLRWCVLGIRKERNDHVS